MLCFSGQSSLSTSQSRYLIGLWISFCSLRVLSSTLVTRDVVSFLPSGVPGGSVCSSYFGGPAGVGECSRRGTRVLFRIVSCSVLGTPRPRSSAVCPPGRRVSVLRGEGTSYFQVRIPYSRRYRLTTPGSRKHLWVSPIPSQFFVEYRDLFPVSWKDPGDVLTFSPSFVRGDFSSFPEFVSN